MKTCRLTLSVIGIVAVTAATLIVWQQRRLTQSRAEIECLRSETALLPGIREDLARLRPVEVDQAELARLRQSQTAGQLELVKLRAQAAKTLRAEAEAARVRAELEQQTAQGLEPTNGIAAPMAALVQGSLEQTYQRRLSRMQERLNLSPAQAQAIQEILNRKAQGLAEAMKGVYSGKIDPQKMAAFRHGEGDPESQIRALLSPEQQAAYAAFKEEERENQARLSANGELVQMQHALGLAEDQQDKVFAVLHDQALQQSQAEADGPEPANPAEAMRIVMDRKLQALAGVLTPKQLAGYRQQEELHFKLVQGIVSRMEPSTAQP